MLSGFIGTAVFPLRKVQQLALEQLAAKRCDPVGEDHAFDVVVFVLDDPRLESRELLVVLDEVGVHVAHADRQRAGHVGMNPGEREAALVIGLLLLGKFVNLGIDESALVIGARRVLLGPRSAVDDEQTNVLADLGRSQSDAFGLFEREEHVLGEFFHIGVIGRNRLAFAAQHLISVNYNRVYHNKIYKQFFAGNLAFARRYRGLRPRLQV